MWLKGVFAVIIWKLMYDYLTKVIDKQSDSWKLFWLIKFEVFDKLT